MKHITSLDFLGGTVAIDPESVWQHLQRWLDVDTSRRCGVHRDSLGYCCRLTWDTTSKTDSGGVSARSKLGIADAVANALQAASDSAPPRFDRDAETDPMASEMPLLG